MFTAFLEAFLFQHGSWCRSLGVVDRMTRKLRHVLGEEGWMQRVLHSGLLGTLRWTHGIASGTAASPSTSQSRRGSGYSASWNIGSCRSFFTMKPGAGSYATNTRRLRVCHSVSDKYMWTWRTYWTNCIEPQGNPHSITLKGNGLDQGVSLEVFYVKPTGFCLRKFMKIQNKRIRLHDRQTRKDQFNWIPNWCNWIQWTDRWTRSMGRWEQTMNNSCLGWCKSVSFLTFDGWHS